MSSGKVTVRGQRRKKNHTKARLILFGALVLLLILAAIFAETLCPYDPNQQDLLRRFRPPGAGHLFGTDSVWKGYAFQGDRRCPGQHIFRADPGSSDCSRRDSDRYDLRLHSGGGGQYHYAHRRYLSGISGSGVCLGDCGCFKTAAWEMP